jgi:hypothetical protein
MMLGLWPCKVWSMIHINGRRVSEPVREDKGKMTAMEPKDEKDPKRARVVMSKGHEVVRLGYSRLTGVVTKVTDRRENSGNPNWVNRVSKTKQHYPSRVSRVSQGNRTDRQAERVSQVSQNNSTDQQANWVSRVIQNSSTDQ